MSIKDKVMNMVIRHPKIVTFGIGLVIAFGIITIIGTFDIQHVLAQPTDRFGGPL